MIVLSVLLHGVEPMRVAALMQLVVSFDGARLVVVLVAESARARTALGHTILRDTLLRQAALLAAAASDALSSPEEVRAQAARLLETPPVREHLQTALKGYFSLSSAGEVSLNPEVTPGLTVTSGMQAAIVREAELFI